LPILIGIEEESSQTLLDESASAVVDLRTKSLDTQSEGVLHNPFELLGETPPLRAPMKDTGADQVSEEMEETALFEKRPDFVVSAEEIADQDAGKKFSQHLFEDRGGPGGGDEVIGDFRGPAGEAPEPIGFAEHSPAGFIDLEERAALGQHSQLVIPGGKDLRQAMPGQGQAPWGEGEG
jgi:hypothetical protein